jgi:hypothetical protein
VIPEIETQIGASLALPRCWGWAAFAMFSSLSVFSYQAVWPGLLLGPLCRNLQFVGFLSKAPANADELERQLLVSEARRYQRVLLTALMIVGLACFANFATVHLTVGNARTTPSAFADAIKYVSFQLFPIVVSPWLSFWFFGANWVFYVSCVLYASAVVGLGLMQILAMRNLSGGRPVIEIFGWTGPGSRGHRNDYPSNHARHLPLHRSGCSFPARRLWVDCLPSSGTQHDVPAPLRLAIERREVRFMGVLTRGARPADRRRMAG